MPNVHVSDMVRRLLRRGGTRHAAKILAKTHPADTAALFRGFSQDDQVRLFRLIESTQTRADVLSHLDRDLVVDLVERLGVDETFELLVELSSDDVADILASLPTETSRKLLDLLEGRGEGDDVADLMRYDINTAGGIMSPDYLALPDDLKVAEAIRQIQENPHVEMAFYVYVVTENGLLVGVVSLRQLVTSKPDAVLHDIMQGQVVSVHTSVDQEEVARIVSRYDLLAVPVVDDSNNLLGIVTVDDVIDVIREEASEDMLKLVGAGEQLTEVLTVGDSVKRRLPWLAAAWIGGVGASFVIDAYNGTLMRLLPLAAFIPVVLGMGGNVGTQTLTIMVRSIATGRLEFRQAWSVVGREFLVGFLLGAAYGLLLATAGYAVNYGREPSEALAIAIIVGTSTLACMTIAAVVGSAVPILLHRLHIDPAVATGPFVTTAMDILGVLVYFNIALLAL
jgi:magnesium transporter